MKKHKTGLFFGSFNPIHLGHLSIANYFLNNTELNEVWFIVSPYNPLKQSSELADEKHRFNMVQLAIQNLAGLHASDIEFSMDRPSYTYDTMKKLEQLFPEKLFIIIMGTDSIRQIEQWKNYKKLLKEHEIYIYPREENDQLPEITKNARVNIFPCPLLPVSSTEIRGLIQHNKNFSQLVSPKVAQYINKHDLYQS